PRYRSAFEPGCANGEMTAALAPRCDALLAADRHPRAVEAAAARAAHDQNAAHVRVETIQVPAEWPQQRFDLVVLSEFCYYLAPDQVAVLARNVRE
ncbi:methyltransferase, partial [Acinetobacter baumannii]